MKINILACTFPGWTDVDKYIERAVSNSPIRYLDEWLIGQGSLYAYIISLELYLGNQITHLTQAELSLDHISLTFGIECDELDILLFMDFPGSKSTVSRKVDRRERIFIILTMTLTEWKKTILTHSKASSDKYKRELVNNFYGLFKQANLGELFSSFTVHELSDNTFALEE